MKLVIGMIAGFLIDFDKGTGRYIGGNYTGFEIGRE